MYINWKVLFSGNCIHLQSLFRGFYTVFFFTTRNVKMASSQDAWYLSLLGLAENFRTSNPPNIKSCIQCLQAVFNFRPPPRVEARTHLQLGNILLIHTKNIELARSHLEKAVSIYLPIETICIFFDNYCEVVN